MLDEQVVNILLMQAIWILRNTVFGNRSMALVFKLVIFLNKSSWLKVQSMVTRVVEFSSRGIKLPKNQHTQRKLLNFENWCNGEVSKSAKILLSKSIFYVKTQRIKKKIEKDSDDFWHRKLTLKVKFWDLSIPTHH